MAADVICVWVIIVGYRNAEEIETCLCTLSLQSQTDWGVLVCENGGSEAFAHLTELLCKTAPIRRDDSLRGIRATYVAELAGDHPLYLLEAENNLGYAGAINAAIACIQQFKDWSYIWILNPDTEPDGHALAQLLTKAQEPTYGIIGSKLIYKDTQLVQAYGGVWKPHIARGISLGRDDPPYKSVNVCEIENKMNYVLGACMLVTRDYIDEIGVMRDDYFLYCEEVDWCLRRKAFRLGYADKSVVYHTQGTTIGSKGSASGRSRLAVFLDERNRLLISRRFYRRWFVIIALIAGLRIGRYAKNAAWQNFFVAVQGWLAGLRNQSGAVGPL